MWFVTFYALVLQILQNQIMGPDERIETASKQWHSALKATQPPSLVLISRYLIFWSCINVHMILVCCNTMYQSADEPSFASTYHSNLWDLAGAQLRNEYILPDRSVNESLLCHRPPKVSQGRPLRTQGTQIEIASYALFDRTLSYVWIESWMANFTRVIHKIKATFPKVRLNA